MAYTDKLIRNRKRYILDLHTDVRAAFMKSKLNPMLNLCFNKLDDPREKIVQTLKTLLNTKTEQPL